MVVIDLPSTSVSGVMHARVATPSTNTVQAPQKPAAQPISNSQLETVLGNSGGLLSTVTSKLGLGRDNVASALGYLVPNLVEAMFTDFPGNSGETVRISVAPEKKRGN